MTPRAGELWEAWSNDGARPLRLYLTLWVEQSRPGFPQVACLCLERSRAERINLACFQGDPASRWRRVL